MGTFIDLRDTAPTESPRIQARFAQGGYYAAADETIHVPANLSFVGELNVLIRGFAGPPQPLAGYGQFMFSP